MREVTEFSVGDVLRTSLLVLTRNLPAFAPMAALAFAPLLIVDAVAPPPPLPAPGGQPDPAAVRELLAQLPWRLALNLACATWLLAGLAYGVVRSLRGGQPGFATVLAESVRSLVVAIPVALATTVAIAVGLMLLIVPGIFLSLTFWVAVPAAAVERRGFAAAIRRSVELTAGNWGPLFGLMLILVALSWGVATVQTAIGAQLNPDLAIVVNAVVTIAMGGYGASVIAVSYHDLRVLADRAGGRAGPAR